MEKLNIDTFFSNEETYEQAKRKYIAEYRVDEGSFFVNYVNRPDLGEAKWNYFYPKGFIDWRETECRVAYSDAKILENKINEIIDALHKEVK